MIAGTFDSATTSSFEAVPGDHERPARRPGQPERLRAAESARRVQRLDWPMSFAAAGIAFFPALAVGSFLNVVAARVPLKRSIVAAAVPRA